MTGIEAAVRREESLREQAAAQNGLVTSAQCGELGLTHSQVRLRCGSGEWRRLCHGVYLVDAHLHGEEDLPRLALRATLLALGADAAVVLESAAHLHGLQGLPRKDGVHHVSRPRPSRRRHRPEARIHHLSLLPEHLMEIDGMRVTTPLRTIVDLLCRLGRSNAVSLLDSALHQGLLAPDDLAEVGQLLRNRPGGARARRWLPLADGRAESPLETRVRLNCVDGGVAPDDLQHPIRDERGVLLGIADMVWTRHRVVGEADGVAPHEEPKALFRDRRRQNDLANAGWTVLRFTWDDTMRRGYVAGIVRRALSAAA